VRKKQTGCEIRPTILKEDKKTRSKRMHLQKKLPSDGRGEEDEKINEQSGSEALRTQKLKQERKVEENTKPRERVSEEKEITTREKTIEMRKLRWPRTYAAIRSYKENVGKQNSGGQKGGTDAAKKLCKQTAGDHNMQPRISGERKGRIRKRK